MKKVLLILSMFALFSCADQQIPLPQQVVNLTPPTKVKVGYIKLVQNANYYVDTNSIWVDNEDNGQVHFDAVINLDKGLYVYPDPRRYARSVRQYKILNCNNYRLTQVRTDFYDDYWGEGLRAAPKHQKKYTLRLQPNSSLYTLGQIICVNNETRILSKK